MDLPIQPSIDDDFHLLNSRALNLTWTSQHPFKFDGTTYSCIEEAFAAQTDIDGYEIYMIAALVKAQADQNETMANTLVRLRNETIEETCHTDEFWIEHMPKIFAAVGADLYESQAGV